MGMADNSYSNNSGELLLQTPNWASIAEVLNQGKILHTHTQTSHYLHSFFLFKEQIVANVLQGGEWFARELHMVKLAVAGMPQIVLSWGVKAKNCFEQIISLHK